MMKVALYARVSTEQQIENYSIPLQKERIRAFCMAKGWSEIVEYVDGGYSGSNLNRPALQQLKQDIEEKKINAVIVYRLDRLSRSQRDTLYLIEEMFLPNHVEFISISETIDTSTPFGRAMIGVMSVFAQLERETITERLRSGRLKMVKDEGLWAGGADASPYGYTRLERGKLVVNEEEAKHVLRIFEEYITLKSYLKVQTKLEEEGFKPLKDSRITMLLKNRLYIGEVSFSGEWFKGSHQPLVSVDLFNAAQKINEHFKGFNFGKIKNNVFRHKVICGCCGEHYVSHSAKAKKTGEQYYYMVCRRRKFPGQYESKCQSRRIKRSDLENEIFNRIKQLETSAEIELTKKMEPIDYDQKMKSIDEKINKLLDLYMDDRLPKGTLDAKLADLNAQRENLLTQSKETQYETSLMEEFITNGIPNLFECDLDTQTAIIDLFVNQITITEDGLQVIWNQ
ncbi:recombinase family protein [Turicibacter sanguinis]|uniref:recombinase family protein n=1 Tax=Turicibacter sanguinis TaxID=154288 RepID=UPI0012BD3BAC|nr:recombinase family protein [Turicibacter sp.]MTN82239.1 recombinase family protein [Turicibacter sanguinis]MTN83173.1 recombinase family protein [Turicibacter sanguinis]MTN88106.1 recombinase family protein [Turicibacter sanguinis]MTN90961.1 recombinase family protein [Turicibacter sanguinis]